MEFIIADINDPFRDDWNRFVEDMKGTVFHLYQWPQILQKTYGYKPLYFYATENNEIQGVLSAVITTNPFRKRMLSLPFADYAGPLAKNDQIKNGLISLADKYRERHGCTFECITREQLNKENSVHYCDSFLVHTTESFDSVWKNSYEQSVRRAVRKAEKSEVKIFLEGQNFLPQYYSVYINTVKKLGVMPQSFDLFSNMQKMLGSLMEIRSAKVNDLVIGAMITFKFNNLIHVWGSVSRKEYLSFAPNNALYNEVIKDACEKKFGCVDLGTSAFGTSHHAFKEGWGGTTIPIYKTSFPKRGIEKTENRKMVQENVVKIVPEFMLGSLGEMVFRFVY